MPSSWGERKRDRFLSDTRHYYWDDPELYRICSDQIIRRCVPDHEVQSILSFCHDQACGGHFGGKKTAHKILQSGFYWPTIFKDAQAYVKACPKCQKAGTLGRRNEMPMKPILIIKIFDVWGIDFMALS